MKLRKVLSVCAISLLTMAVLPKTYAQMPSPDLVKEVLIRNSEPKIEERPLWLRELVAGKKVNYLSNLEEGLKIKPDKQVHTLLSTIRNFEEKGDVVRLICSNESLSMSGVLLDFGTTGIKELDEDLVEFIENNAQKGRPIYVIGTYDNNTEMRLGALKIKAPVLTVLFASTGGQYFEPKKFKAAHPESFQVQKNNQVESTPTPPNENLDSSGGTEDVATIQANELEKSDKRLNDVYKKIMVAIKDPQAKKNLRNEQRQWIKDRDKYCAPPKTNHALGSIWNNNEKSCIVYWTDFRADQLEEMLSDYE